MGYEKYSVVIGEDVVQRVVGEVTTKTIVAKLSNDFIKLVNEISDGNVFFMTKRDSWGEKTGVELDYASGYYEAREKLKQVLRKYVIQKYNEGKLEEVVIDKDTIDLTEFKKVCEEIRQRLEKEREEEMRRREIKNRIREIVENRDFMEVNFYSSYAEIRVFANTRQGKVQVDELHIKYDEDSIKKLENYEYTTALEKYIEKLLKENAELREKLEKRKEEIVKEIWENNETIEIEDTCTTVLKVVAEDDDC